eukprot:gene17000-19440_t
MRRRIAQWRWQRTGGGRIIDVGDAVVRRGTGTIDDIEEGTVVASATAQPAQEEASQVATAQGGGVESSVAPSRPIGHRAYHSQRSLTRSFIDHGPAAPQHIAKRIGSDAVEVRDDGRRGGGDGMGVATNDGGGGDGDGDGGGGGSSTTRRWFLATLPGTQDTPPTSNPPFDWNKTYINNAARNMRTPCGLGWCSSGVFGDSAPWDFQFHCLFALFYRLAD